MSDAVSQERSIFSTLALALLFISQVLGVYMTHALSLPPPQVALFGAVFFTTVLICATILPRLCVHMPDLLSGRPRRGIFSPLLLLLAFCAALLLVGHGMDGTFAIALRSAGVGILWITALHAFFLFAPKRRKGLLLGLAAASGELIWVALLPAVNVLSADAASPGNHLYKLHMAVQFGSLLLLAAAFAFRPVQAGNAQPDAPYNDSHSKNVAGAVLPLLFLAAVILYILYGQATGLAFLRVGHISEMPDSVHILLLLTLPLTGALFDRGDRGCRWLLTALVVLAFAAPIMLFTAQEDVREILFALLCVGRQSVFLVTLLLADRLIRDRKRLPLLLALAYILPTLSIAGRAIARLDIKIAVEAGIAVVLAVTFAFLVMRLRGALSDLPLAEDEADVSATPVPAPEPDSASDRLAAFAAAHGLSRQETSVMEMLAQGRSTEHIATSMNVAEGTVRKYVSRILQKADVPNRAALMALFTAPNRKPAQTTEADTRVSR